MMLTFCVIAFVCVLFVGNASAQVSIGGTFSFAIPTGDLADMVDPGFGVGADAFVDVPLTGLEVGGHVGYSRFDYSDVDESFSTIEILPSVRYSISVPFILKVFLQGGAGMYRWDSSYDDGTDFGICLGGGVQGKAGPTIGLVAMPLYHIIMTEDENTTYATMNIGVVF